MEDNTKNINVKSVTKTIVIGSIVLFVVSPIKGKDFELHSQEMFHQDQISLTPSASGAYGAQAIGSQYVMKTF